MYYNNRVVQLKYLVFSISIVHYILDATLGCFRAKYSIESWAHCSHECNIGFSEGNLTAAARQLRATLSQNIVGKVEKEADKFSHKKMPKNFKAKD